jgi:transmembrane sensor
MAVMEENEFYTLLVQRYVDNLLTAEEYEVFFEALRAGRLSAQLLAAMTGFAAFPAADPLTETLARETTETPIGPAEAKRTPVRRLPIWKWTAAAALILLAGAGTLLLLRHPVTPIAQTTQNKNDVPPGHSGAILTLSGGKQLVLDSAANGKVAAQGAVSILKNNDQLSYTGGSGGEAPPKNARTPQADAHLIYNTLSTPRGRQYQLMLSDGTRVWLNAASSITYPTLFSGSERSVTITGEAYFEVEKNAAQPFTVRAGQYEIEVLGTSFNVNAYADEPVSTTTLIDGSVKVAASSSSRGGSEKLSPGQQAQLVDRKPIKVVNDVDVDEAIAWKNGRFAFHDADLPTVMRQIARWYDVTVTYERELPKREFNGKIGRSLTLDQVLRILTKTRVHYTIEKDRHLIIRP